MKLQSKTVLASYLRNFVFGVEDSLVSTVGLLSGTAIAGMSSQTIFVTGVILIFVEAFSMAVGSFLSERSAEEYLEPQKIISKRSIFDGVIMFFSYFITGFIPLFPYIFSPVPIAFWLSIILTLASLFLLGVIGAKISKTNALKNGLRTLIVGGIAVLIGVIAGQFFKIF